MTETAPALLDWFRSLPADKRESQAAAARQRVALGCGGFIDVLIIAAAAAAAEADAIPFD